MSTLPPLERRRRDRRFRQAKQTLEPMVSDFVNFFMGDYGEDPVAFVAALEREIQPES